MTATRYTRHQRKWRHSSQRPGQLRQEISTEELKKKKKLIQSSWQIKQHHEKAKAWVRVSLVEAVSAFNAIEPYVLPQMWTTDVLRLQCELTHVRRDCAEYKVAYFHPYCFQCTCVYIDHSF